MNFSRMMWVFLGAWYAWDAFRAFSAGSVVFGMTFAVIGVALLADLVVKGQYLKQRLGIVSFGFAALGALYLPVSTAFGLLYFALAAFLLWSITRKSFPKKPDDPHRKK